MKTTRLLLFLLCISMAGQAQLVNDSILVEGSYRSFHYNLPGKTPEAGSLVFILHGSGGSGINIMKQAARLEAIRERENLLVVYPDAFQHYWNECRKFSTAVANKNDINENAFFQAMIDHFHKAYHIDTKKVFAVGFSGGGHMAYKLALTMPGTIRAVTAIVANLPDSASMDCGEARKPIPVMIINGTMDGTNPYNGGEMFVNNTSFGVVRSTEKTLAYWANVAGYTGQPVEKELPDTDPSDKKTITSYTYRKPGKPEIVLLKVVGGHHDYPNDIDVYVTAWEFFKRSVK